MQCLSVPQYLLRDCSSVIQPVCHILTQFKWAWECWEHLDCAFHSSNPGLCGCFSGELSLCYPQSNTHIMSVFLHSQCVCLNVHKMERFCPRYAHVTGVGDSLCVSVLFVCPTSCSLAVLCFPIPWVGVLLETSFVVPRRQKVAFPVYYLYKFCFIHPVEACVSWMLKRDWPAFFSSVSGGGVQPLPSSGTHLPALPLTP